MVWKATRQEQEAVYLLDLKEVKYPSQEGSQNTAESEDRILFFIRRKQKEILDEINLTQINYFVKKGILNPNSPITIKHLVDCGLVKKVRYGVKVLGRGYEKIDYPLHLEVSDASANAIKLIESKGGSVKLIFRTQLKLKEHINP